MNTVKSDESAETKALKDFLLDINCLDPLYEWTNKFNLFDILKITRTEIRHSNMLSWLLDPNETHGLGDNVLKGFVQHTSQSLFKENDLFEILLMDFYNFTIQREWHNIDIVAVSNEKHFVLCIENKIDSNEHDNQLERYRKIIMDTYPEYTQIFLYLSPQGIDASDSENWVSISYNDVLEIIENTKKKVKLLPEVALLIDNYTDIIRRHIVEDKKLIEICTNIYV